MRFPWISLLPLLHALAVVVLFSALALIKKHAGLGGILALVAFLCTLATGVAFVILFRGGM
mgnify:CR=1 FL=1